MTNSIRRLSLVLLSAFILGAVATRNPGSEKLDAEFTDGLDKNMEEELNEDAEDLLECACQEESHEKMSSAGELMCEYQDGRNCARTVNDDGSPRPCEPPGVLCRKRSDFHEEREVLDTPVDSNAHLEHEEVEPKACESGPASTKTVEIIFVVTGEEDGPKVLTKRSRDGQAMNCGGSFYMQCECDDFHPDKDEATSACYAPTPDGLPTAYAGEDFDKGEANQLAFAAKKLFHTQTDPAKTIAILEAKNIKRMTLAGDGNKLYRVYPMPLKSSSLLDKTVESKEFEKLKCSDIVDEANPLNVDGYFRDLIKQLRIKGC